MNPLGLNLSQVSAHAGSYAGERLPFFAILIFFLVLHLAVGSVLPYREGYRPLLRAGMEKMARALERRWNREERKSSQLAARGALTLLILATAGGLIGHALSFVPAGPLRWVAELTFLSLCLSVMGPLKVLREAGRRAAKEETGKVVMTLQPYVFNEELRFCDDYTINRRALEFAAVEFNRGFFAPAFYFIAGGPVALALYVSLVAVYDIAQASPHYGGPARFAERWIDIPALFAAPLLACAGIFVSKGSALRGLTLAMAQAGRYDSVPRGWLVAVVAGALGVTLGGPLRVSDSVTSSRAWIGPEGTSAKISINNLERGRLLFFTAFLCGIVLFSGVFMVFLYFT